MTLIEVDVASRFMIQIDAITTREQVETLVKERIAAVVPPGVPNEVLSLRIRRVPRPGDIFALDRSGKPELAKVVEVVVDPATGAKELRGEFADGVRVVLPARIPL